MSSSPSWVSSVAWWTRVAAVAVGMLLACQPPSPSATASGQREKPGRARATGTDGDLPGIDTSELTAREQREWWAHVSELLAPCANQPVSIAQCVDERRPCAACKPAAEFLLEQVALGKTRAQIEEAFTLRFDPDSVKQVKADGAPSKGAKDAAVTIVEWADFECPFCAMTAPVLSYLVKAYPDHLRVVFKHFPISYHEYGIAAAKAAIAAGKQGKFWEMHDKLYEHREELGEALFDRLAQELKLDLDRFHADMASQATLDLIERDRREADALGLKGTPMIYINGRSFDLRSFDLMRDLEPWVGLEIEMIAGKQVGPRVARPNWEKGPAGSSPIEEPIP